MAGRILIFPLLAIVLAAAGCSDSGEADGAEGARTAPADADSAERAAPRPRPSVVQALPPGAEATAPPDDFSVDEPEVLPEDEAKPARVAATDAELKSDLAQFRRVAPGGADRAVLNSDGTASPPFNAPPAVHEIIHAGNMIASMPYKWGGGHGRWLDDGYDCSGSVSFALFAGGLLNSPLTSGGFMNWGRPGPGRWVTLYTNPGHIYMVVAGLRFDTSGQRQTGSRWQTAMRSGSGYVVRHPPGL